MVVWFNELSHIPDDVFAKTIKRYIRTQKKFPCIADLFQSNTILDWNRAKSIPTQTNPLLPDPQGKAKVQNILKQITNPKKNGFS